MMTIRYAAILPLLIVCGLLLTECRARREIDLPTTAVLQTRDRWGVVTARYVRMHADRAIESEIRGFLRRGEIVDLVRQSPILDTVLNQEDFWYFALIDGRSGWIFGSHIETYSTQGRATNAARLLQEAAR